MERFDLFMIESIFLSFDHIKQSIWLKNRWSNSKPEKSEREHITLDYFKKRAASVIRLWLEQIALKKRAIFSQKTIDSIEKTDDRIPNPAKERLWVNQSRFLLKRAVSVIRSWFERITIKKQAICLKEVFSYVFDSFSQFSPLSMPKSRSLLSLCARSNFLKSDRSDSLLLLFKKKQGWASVLFKSVIPGDFYW